jgi:hypothetical protein
MWKSRVQVFNFVTYPYAKASGCGHVIKTHTPYVSMVFWLKNSELFGESHVIELDWLFKFFFIKINFHKLTYNSYY